MSQTIKIISIISLLNVILGCSSNTQENQHGESQGNVRTFASPCFSSERDCVPASILNSLQFGSLKCKNVFSNIPGNHNAEKLAKSIRRLRLDDSSVFSDKKRCGEDGLVFVEDISDCYNCIIREYDPYSFSVRGEFANRIDGETPEDHLQRIRAKLDGSIASGVLPLVSLAQFIADGSEAKDDLEWKGTYGHTIAITSVNPITKKSKSSFAFQYLDSMSGRLEEGYAFLEKRPFAAPMGSNPQTKVQLYDSPYLVVIVPAMELSDGSYPWHRRSIIVLTFIVGEFTPSKTPM